MLLWLPKAPTWFSSCENISGWSSQITLYVWHWSLVIMFFWLKSFSLFISLYSESVMLTTFSNSFEGRVSPPRFFLLRSFPSLMLLRLFRYSAEHIKLGDFTWKLGQLTNFIHVSSLSASFGKWKKEIPLVRSLFSQFLTAQYLIVEVNNQTEGTCPLFVSVLLCPSLV